MAKGDEKGGVSRRTLLVGGGAGIGLVLAWTFWPRGGGLRTGPGETAFNAFLKIGSDGRVIVAVPQAELGQGTWTSLPQILADALGADWRTVGVEPAPIEPFYANAVLAEATGTGTGWLPGSRPAQMATAGSTSVRAFEAPMRDAGTAARALLMKAAARRWDSDWHGLDTAAGFVTDGKRRIAFAQLAEAAAKESLPGNPPPRGSGSERLYGRSLPRLDLPSKVDGTARYAGDVRLPDMLYASVRSGPREASRLTRADEPAARKVPGVVAVHRGPADAWIAVVASNGWAADRGAEALEPAWVSPGPEAESAAIERALSQALASGEAVQILQRGDPPAGGPTSATYTVGAAANAPLEPLTATARWSAGRLEVWAPAQAPGLARASAARAAGISESDVVLYPTMIGGGYGRKLETGAVEQAAVLAKSLGRPVQLVWPRIEETVGDSFRPPAAALMSARLGEGGAILSWRARVAAHDVRPKLEARIGPGAPILRGPADPAAGAVPPYDLPAATIEHVPVATGVRGGLWRSGAHGYTAFFNECFVDELARQAAVEPFSFRMQMLGGNPRLARCLTAATQLGQWDGGPPGSAKGIACLSAFGSHIATLVEVEIAAGLRVRVRRAVCAVDVGRVVNPDILKQQVEGGLLFGIAAASARPIEFAGGRPSARGFAGLGFPALSDAPEVNVEIIESTEAPGGATELAVPTAAPAMANAVFALTGKRLRSLPLVVGTGA